MYQRFVKLCIAVYPAFHAFHALHAFHAFHACSIGQAADVLKNACLCPWLSEGSRSCGGILQQPEKSMRKRHGAMFCFFRSVVNPKRFRKSPREDSCLMQQQFSVNFMRVPVASQTVSNYFKHFQTISNHEMFRKFRMNLTPVCFSGKAENPV